MYRVEKLNYETNVLKDYFILLVILFKKHREFILSKENIKKCNRFLSTH